MWRLRNEALQGMSHVVAERAQPGYLTDPADGPARRIV